MLARSAAFFFPLIAKIHKPLAEGAAGYSAGIRKRAASAPEIWRSPKWAGSPGTSCTHALYSTPWAACPRSSEPYTTLAILNSQSRMLNFHP